MAQTAAVVQPMRITGEGGRREPDVSLLLTLAGIILVALAVFVRHCRYPGIDDAFITYRYARNIAGGLGWVYNPGQRVQGASTPLFTLWLAALSKTGVSIPHLSRATGGLSMCATLVVVFVWLRRLQSAFAGFVAVIFLLASSYMNIAASGMETATYILFLFLAFYLFALGRHMAAFLVAGLCMLTRLDGALVITVLAAVAWWRDGRFPWRPLVAPVALNAAWLGFAWLYFGFPLPNSFLAKRYHTEHHFSPWMFHEAATNAPALWLLALLGIGALLLARRRPGDEGAAGQDEGGSAALGRVKSLELLPLLLWAVGYALAYTVSELEEYPWYVAPMTAALIFFAACGAGWVFTRLAGPANGTRRYAAAALLAAALWPAVLAVHQPFLYGSLEQTRYEGVRYTAAHVPKGAVIASAGIGQLGWFTNNRILDVAGLVSPEVLRRYPQPYFYHSFAGVAVTQKPDYLFDAGPTGLGWPPEVTRNYHRVAVFPTPPEFSQAYQDFVLWKRN